MPRALLLGDIDVVAADVLRSAGDEVESLRGQGDAFTSALRGIVQRHTDAAREPAHRGAGLSA